MFCELSQIISKKIYDAKIHFYEENLTLKLCTCAQSYALGTHTKFQIEILIRGTIYVIRKFQENILESLWNICETTPMSSPKHFVPQIETYNFYSCDLRP